MRNSYDVKLSTLEENLRKEKETGVCCPGAAGAHLLSSLLVTCVKAHLQGRLGLSTPYNPARLVPHYHLPGGEEAGPERGGDLPLATQWE